jgi:hypothetical protein
MNIIWMKCPNECNNPDKKVPELVNGRPVCSACGFWLVPGRRIEYDIEVTWKGAK